MSTPQTLHRALLAKDAAGVVRVLATDSAHIAYDVDAISTDADELGMVAEDDVGDGLYLWTGSIVKSFVGASDERGEWEPEYSGELRAVLDPAVTPDLAAVAEMFAMAPPEPEFDDDDRDSAGV